MSRSRSNASGDRLAAFTLVELLVVISIIALLIALILPALGRSRESGRRSVCQSHMRQFQIACVAYAHDHAGYTYKEFNGSHLWQKGYLPKARVGNGTELAQTGCPSEGEAEPKTGWGGRSFGASGAVYGAWNWTGDYKFDATKRPSVTMYGGDCYTVRIVDPGQHEENTLFLGRHMGEGLGFWFFDGHVEFLRGHDPNAVGQYPNADWRKRPNSHSQLGNDATPPCDLYAGCFWHPF